MGVMRFSMAEVGRGMRGGPEDVAGAVNVVRTAQKMLELGAAAMALEPGMAAEITPPYLDDTEAYYYLATPEEAPVDACTVTIVPNEKGGPRMAFLGGTIDDPVEVVEGAQRIGVPEDVAAFTLTSVNKYSNNVRSSLLIHELIIPQPGKDAAKRIEGLRNSPLLAKRPQTLRMPSRDRRARG
jgi:hypothetical protein